MKKLTTYYIILTILILFLAHTSVLAQTEYKLLAPLPLSGAGSVPTEKTTAKSYIQGIFTLIIAVAGGLAVVQIIFGGIKYMSTDAFEGKSEAKTTIQNAIWGLLLAVSAWLILFTINPKLVDFNLKIPVQEVKTSGVSLPPKIDLANCTSCEVVSIQHKSAPYGCAAPGPCIINKALDDKLVALNKLNTLLVTESFPPTRSHADPCHYNGTCVDATISSNTPQNITSFINNANTAGLRAEFEVQSETRAQAIRQATGLSASQVRVVPGIIGEHFSVYLN